MLRYLGIGSVVGFAFMALDARAQDSPRSRPDASPEFKVAYWFDRTRFPETFQSKAYDLRKGEYSHAVDEWLEKVRLDFPRYKAYVKDVDLKSWPGGSDLEKLAHAAEAERLLKTSSAGGYIGTPGAPGTVPYVKFFDLGPPPRDLGARPSRSLRLGEGLGISPGSGGINPNPPTYLYPTPYPYPRPHP